jgi:predicted dehydrogenase
MNQHRSADIDKASRRDFIKAGAAAVAAGTLAAELTLTQGAPVADSDLLRLGLVGCGGRGTGAALQALQADPHTKLVALADAFADQLQRSLDRLKKSEVADRVAVDVDHRFVGFDAYQKLIAGGVDVVLLAAPPHFRPAHLQAAIDAGKHVFAEKPVAVDAPGVRKVLAACAEAKRKNLAVVSGLCWRYNFTARDAIKQVHDGAVGDIVALQSSYNSGRPGKPWPMVREPGWSDMEWQLRNWYWFTWLSGDHIVEQAVHSLDKAAWAVHDEPPVSAVALGGLQSRSGGDERGQIFDHHAVVYEYANGLKHFHTCRQQMGCANDVSTHVFGTKGTCHVERGSIADRSGTEAWRYRGQQNVMHQTEHDEMYAALRAGKIINDGEFMCRSTMLAILGRMASYTGKKITWEQAMNSQEDLTPPAYAWGPLPKPAVALPGVTRFS